MSSPTVKNIVSLRQLLAERFPGVRFSVPATPPVQARWSTGVRVIDELFEGGLPKSAITEIISAGERRGSALLLSAMIQQASHNGQWLALVDGADSFDPGALENSELNRLIWMRCAKAADAVKAADLLLHDGTVPIVVLDLIGLPAKQVLKTPSSTWFRFQRLVENVSCVLAIFTPAPVISAAEARAVLETRFTLDSLDQDRQSLLSRLAARPYQPSEMPRRDARIA